MVLRQPTMETRETFPSNTMIGFENERKNTFLLVAEIQITVTWCKSRGRE